MRRYTLAALMATVAAAGLCFAIGRVMGWQALLLSTAILVAPILIAGASVLVLHAILLPFEPEFSVGRPAGRLRHYLFAFVAGATGLAALWLLRNWPD